MGPKKRKYSIPRVKKAVTRIIVNKKKNVVVSRSSKIPKSTLSGYTRAWTGPNGELREPPPKLDRRMAFTNAEEKVLVGLLKSWTDRHVEITEHDCRKICYKFGRRLHIRKFIRRWDQTSPGLASWDWFKSFCLRHETVKNLLSPPRRPVPADGERIQERGEPENPSTNQNLPDQDNVTDVPEVQGGGEENVALDPPLVANSEGNNGTSGADVAAQPINNFARKLSEFVDELKRININPSQEDIDAIKNRTLEIINSPRPEAGPTGEHRIENSAQAVPSTNNAATRDVAKDRDNPFIQTYKEKVARGSVDGLEIPTDGQLPYVTRTSRKFLKDEFLCTISGRIVDNDAVNNVLQLDEYRTGDSRGKIFNLGNTERKWIDAANDIILRGVVDSPNPNCQMRYLKFYGKDRRYYRLYLTALRHIPEGEQLTFDFCNVPARNAEPFPFTRLN